MKNIYNYVDTYGNVSFDKSEFNELDNMVFSYLSYLDFTNTKINDGKYSLDSIGKEYLSKNDFRSVARTGIAQKGAYKLLEIVVNKKRYKDIILSDYVYDANKDMQFSAITFNVSKSLKCIYFEGTDEMVGGWKEDCYMASCFPVPSQVEAIKYVNKHIKLFGPKVIVGGHSKGGNLALVASMFLRFYKRFKLVKVYNNDGPGLRNNEFCSKRYKRVRSKLIHIVPDYSMVGVLLNNDVYNVIKSSKKSILAHDMATWIVDDDKLVSSELSLKSRKLERNILYWVNTHSDEEIMRTTNNLFKVLESENIGDTMKLLKLRNVIRVSHKFLNLDKETKNLIVELIMYTFERYDD